MRANRRQIVRAVVAVDLSFTSGARFAVSDRYTKIPVSKAGKFRVAFGPITQRNDDGTTTDIQGRMSSALNRTATWISGSWSLSATEHDTTGAVTDSCSTGSVRWKAKQYVRLTGPRLVQCRARVVESCGSSPGAGAQTRPAVRSGNAHEHQAHRDVAEWRTDSPTAGNVREHLAHQGQ